MPTLKLAGMGSSTPAAAPKPAAMGGSVAAAPKPAATGGGMGMPGAFKPTGLGGAAAPKPAPMPRGGAMAKPVGRLPGAVDFGAGAKGPAKPVGRLPGAVDFGAGAKAPAKPLAKPGKPAAAPKTTRLIPGMARAAVNVNLDKMKKPKAAAPKAAAKPSKTVDTGRSSTVGRYGSSKEIRQAAVRKMVGRNK